MRVDYVCTKCGHKIGTEDGFYLTPVCCGKPMQKVVGGTVWRAATLALLALAGCGGHYEHLAAGSVGCPPDQVSIDNVEHNGSATTWQATCSGRVFDCTQVGNGTVTCSARI